MGDYARVSAERRTECRRREPRRTPSLDFGIGVTEVGKGPLLGTKRTCRGGPAMSAALGIDRKWRFRNVRAAFDPDMAPAERIGSGRQLAATLTARDTGDAR